MPRSQDYPHLNIQCADAEHERPGDAAPEEARSFGDTINLSADAIGPTDCPTCGKEIDRTATSCPRCGTPTWLRPARNTGVDFKWSRLTGADRALLAFRVIGGTIGFYLIAEMTIKEMLRI
jgi:hypothetical protein